MASKLMIEVDEQLLDLLESWKAAGREQTKELERADYDRDRAKAIFRAERDATLKLAIAVQYRIEDAAMAAQRREKA